ncbi:MAG: DinB family protein [Chloroflexi bacterium]|nr:DinB family protein [Chloroflexota bacterium]
MLQRTRDLLIAIDEAWADLLKATDGLTEEEIARQPTPQCNSIAWLMWHTARVEDTMVPRQSGQPQLWISRGWHQRFRMPADPKNNGGLHTVADLAKFKSPGRNTLLAYATAARDQTRGYLSSVTQTQWDEPVQWYRPSGGMVPRSRYMILLTKEILVHGGQVSYLRGLMRGMEKLAFY